MYFCVYVFWEVQKNTRQKPTILTENWEKVKNCLLIENQDSQWNLDLLCHCFLFNKNSFCNTGRNILWNKKSLLDLCIQFIRGGLDILQPLVHIQLFRGP